MASTLYATYENHHNIRRVSHNSMKRSQHPSRSYSLEHHSNFYGLETVGESDARSHRTAEVCHDRPYALSETASEDSCSMKRNLMTVNCNTPVDACNSAAAYFSSKNSLTTRAERNQLRKQLKTELDQVQNLISRLEAREIDLRSFLQIPELENNGSSSKSVCEPTYARKECSESKDFVLGEEQMLVFEKLKAKGGVKRALHLNVDLQVLKRQKFDSNAKKLADLMRQCGTILKKLRTHKYSWVFNHPVDFVALQIPDYPMIIKQPMDLGTIKSKLEYHEYVSPLEFAADVRLTFANAMKFNPKGHDVHFMAEFLLKVFEDRWKGLDKKLKQLNLHCDSTMRRHHEPAGTAVQNPFPTASAGHSGAARGHNQSKLVDDDVIKRQMTYEEKQVLSQMLEEVPMDKLDQVLAIIKRKDPDVKPVDGEVTIEIDCLDSDSLWELYNLLKHPKVASKSICQDSKQPDGEIIQPLPGAGNHSRSAFGEGDAKDEEVDIGVDAPTTSYAPVDIDKDAASPSSSSSSDSSSCSDSDSGSTSGSESDADDAQSRGSGSKVSPGKEPAGSGAVCEPRGSPTPKMDDAKRPLSDLDEEVSLTRPTVLDGELNQRGESGVPEHQIQEKLLRAALLKNRFADTILKAREKTLPLLAKSNGTDPEKLRREREELERLQQEEKARLQAEAKVAENARRKAEADAMAKARCEREAERRAARLVLQQMERTVEIDENRDFLKDLELLGTAPVEHLPVVCESSPAHSQEGLPAFPFQCGNPLEQLGLFMKVDDEEDDQETLRPLGPQMNPSPHDQNEEGEIDD